MARPLIAAGARVRLTLLLAAMTAFPPMAIDQYLPALPIIRHELNASAGEVQATLSIFFISFSVGQLIYGPFSDRYGRRWPLLAGIALFIAASVGCACARSIEALVFWRVVQSLGGGGRFGDRPGDGARPVRRDCRCPDAVADGAGHGDRAAGGSDPRRLPDRGVLAGPAISGRWRCLACCALRGLHWGCRSRCRRRGDIRRASR